MISQEKDKRSLLSRLPFVGGAKTESSSNRESSEEDDQTSFKAPKWSFGVLNDKETVEVPGKTCPALRPCAPTILAPKPLQKFEYLD